MATYTQDTRLIGIETPLGKDVLLLRGFSGQETLSQLSAFELDLLSKDPEIKFEDIIGKRVTLRVTLSEDKTRYFNGFISRFVQTGAQTGMPNYRATMVPWLWFLTKTTDCRIFQNKSTPDIIQQICKEYGFTDIKTKLQGTYEPRDYCVQYRETDYNFVARLMEQYGIFYFFEHEKEKHTLVLTDNPDAHQPCPEQPKAKWNPQGSKSLTEDVVTTLEVEKIFRPGKYALTDYNFETPSTSLLSEIDTTITVGGNTKYEVYDYPGEYEKKAQGKTMVKLRMEEQEVKHLSVTGTSSCRAFATGYRFDFEDYSRADLNQAYVLTSLSHSATVGDTYTTGKTSDGSSAYTNAFTCIPHSVPFRPPQITPKPIIQGPQTAVIVGPAGEEIYSDKYGRVKAQFHWDREGKNDENSSCWIRSSQNWAGKQWGGVFLPRIGQEVIIEFLEGDPDRPIITGRVYNAEQMPPYALPGNQTQSGVKSNSSKGGGGSNEWRFEDKKGSEEIYLHGQKDWNIVIENDKGQTIGHDEALHVKNDRTKLIDHDENSEIKNNRNKKVGVDQSETIGSNKSIKVGGSHKETIDGDMSVLVKSTLTETVAINYMENVGAAMELTVGGALAVSVGAAMAETVGLNKTQTIGVSKDVTVGKKMSLQVGKSLTENIGENQTVEIGKDLKENIGGEYHETVKKDYMLKAKKILLLADDEVSIKAGSAEMVLKKNGNITLKGNKITVEGSGDVAIKGSKVKVN